MVLMVVPADRPSWILCDMAWCRRQSAPAIARPLIGRSLHFPRSAARFRSLADRHRLSEPGNGLPRKCPSAGIFHGTGFHSTVDRRNVGHCQVYRQRLCQHPVEAKAVLWAERAWPSG
jgi:hypothetical protein